MKCVGEYKFKTVVVLLLILALPGCNQSSNTSTTNGDVLTDSQVAELRHLEVNTVALLHTMIGMTNSEICDIPADKLQRAIRKITQPKPDHPDAAVAFRLKQLRDQNGLIPANGYALASRHMALMRSTAASKAVSALAPSAVMSPGKWTSIGPGNIGGRIRSIVIHPTQPNKMWVGSVSGGIWKTVNGGISWRVVNDFMANLAVSTMVINKANPNVMYAGTGEGFYNIDGIRGAGIFKSVNGGITWTQLAATANANFYYVNRLAISPSNPSVLLAATRQGLWRSVNAGTTWVQVNALTDIADVDFHPTNGNLAVASSYRTGAFYSTNGGASWLPATGLPPGRVEVTYATATPNVVFASVNNLGGEVYKSIDGGKTYVLVSSGFNYLGRQGWYDNVIWVDPLNSNIIIVGGIDLWRSSDGGVTFNKISVWWMAPASAHADHHVIVAHPNYNNTTNRTVFFGNDGGIYKTLDARAVSPSVGWQELNNQLSITQFYGGAGNASSGVIIGGTQDNGTLRYSGGSETWTTMFGGDGGYNAADQTNPNYFYGEYVYLQIHRSTDGGISSQYIYTGLGDANNPAAANFIAPFIISPNNPNRLLAGGASLWGSNNAKAVMPTWAAIKPPVGSNISAIAEAPGSANIIWVGHNNGAVYKTSNGTAAAPAWVRVDNAAPGLPNRFVTRITIDPTNPNIVYVTFGGFSAGNIWRTDNGGLSWVNASGTGPTGLPAAPVRTLVVDPVNSNTIYAGTEVGVFVSLDKGVSWGLPQTGPANVSVDELFLLGQNTLVAATHGRGMFKFNLRAVVPNDFNGDGKSDILFRETAPTGRTLMKLMNGRALISQAFVSSLPASWPLVGTGDFNGDGKSDTLYRQASTGRLLMKLMNGHTLISHRFVSSLPATWAFAGTGDFNGDGKSDMLFREISTGRTLMKLMNGFTLISQGFVSSMPPTWPIAGTGDFNGDGKADILFRQASTGRLLMKLMNGRTLISQRFISSMPATWTFAGTGDFNGDGKSDTLFRQVSTGHLLMKQMNGFTLISQAFVSSLPASWPFAGTGDFNGDGKSDMLFRHPTNGRTLMKLMNGFTLVSQGFVSSMPATWSLVNTK